MAFISPQSCILPTEGCCEVTFTGFCLADGTPIGLVIQEDEQKGWFNFLTAIFTPGPPPSGTGPCPVTTAVTVDLDCATDSITVCPPVSGVFDVKLDAPTLAALETVTVLQGTSPWVVSGGASAPLTCATDSVTVCQGTTPWTITGTVELGATTLAALETITVLQGTSPWVVSGTVAATQSGVWTVNVVEPVTVDGTVELGATTLAALETITVLQGTSPWVVSGTITANTNFAYAEDSVHVSGDVGAFVLGVRNDFFTTLTSAEGDYSPFNVDQFGRLRTIPDGVRPEDSAHTSGDAGYPVLAVRNDTVAVVTSADGDYSQISVDSAGRLLTKDQQIEDAAHTTGDTGSFVLAVRNDAGTPLAGTTLDYIPLTTDSNGDLWVTTGRTGIITNGAETAVAGVAVSVLAANTARKKYIIQNTGLANVRVGVAGVTATTGFRLVPDGSMIIEMPNCPTQDIFAIREGATSSTVFAQEVT